MKSSWPQIRAALIALHILAVILVAFPAPAPLNIDAGDPNVALHVGPWARLLGARDQTAFAQRVLAIGKSWLEVRARVIWPFKRYLDRVGAIQSWHMFSAPNRTPIRFVLEGRRAGGEWQFVSGVPVGEWRQSFFSAERTRSLLNSIGKYENERVIDPFCLPMAHELLAESDFTEVRCQLVRTQAPSIHAPLAPRESRVVYTRIVAR